MSERHTPERTLDREWYADGLRFKCTSCGNCCTGPPGYVWITTEEGAAIAARLGVTEQVFYKKYAKKLRGRWSLDEVETKYGYDCVFLDRKTIPGKGICSIYEDRPVQCRTWPFWPENLVSEDRWEGVKEGAPCPGMNEGKLIPIEDIRIHRDATP